MTADRKELAERVRETCAKAAWVELASAAVNGRTLADLRVLEAIRSLDLTPFYAVPSEGGETNAAPQEPKEIATESNSVAAPDGAAPERGELVERLHSLVCQLAERFKGYIPWPDDLRTQTVRSHEMFIADAIKKADALLDEPAFTRSREVPVGWIVVHEDGRPVRLDHSENIIIYRHRTAAVMSSKGTERVEQAILSTSPERKEGEW